MSNGCSTPEQLSEIDKGRSQQTMANIGLAVGIVGLAASATLVILSNKGNGSAPSSTVAVTGLPGGGSLSYLGKF